MFVFDGKTPELKLRTVKARRNTRDKNENDKKMIAQRIILSQIKQQQLRSKLEQHSSSDGAEAVQSGKFASSFNPPTAEESNTASGDESCCPDLVPV